MNQLCGSLVTKSCPTLCDPMDCSPPGSYVHGNSQAGMLEWVAISFSRGSCLVKEGLSVPPALAEVFFTTETPGKPHILLYSVFIIEIVSFDPISIHLG